MQYKVVPFVANVSSTQGAAAAASQLESLIASHASDGWEYMRLENVETSVAGTHFRQLFSKMDIRSAHEESRLKAACL